jgi:Tripartite tricarboxylate transporter TctB family
LRKKETKVQVKSKKDFWSGMMFTALGVGFAWGALSYSFGSSARPGPAYFPFGLGVLLALLGAVVLFKSMTVETEDGDPIGGWAWRPLGVLVGALVLFGFGLPHLGLLVSLPLLVIITSMASEEFRWKDAVLNAVVLTALSWTVFVKGLGLTLPVLPKFLG